MIHPMRKLMPPLSPARRILGRHSLVRFFLVRGLVLAGAAALIVSYGFGGAGRKPLLAVAASGLAALTGTAGRTAGMSPAAPADAPVAAGGCGPFECAAGPRPKWVSAPPTEADAQPYRAPETLVIRSALTGEPYPAPDKPPLVPVAPMRAAVQDPR